MKECLPIWTVAVRPGEAGSPSQVVYTEPLASSSSSRLCIVLLHGFCWCLGATGRL